MKYVGTALIAFLFSAFIVSTSQAAEALSVAELGTQQASLSGKQVSVEGKVVKVNNGIMRRNFIHVDDGTGTVIFTSQQVAKVGDEVVATGTVTLNTDFGMGYFYPLLVENSTFAPAK